MKSRSVTMCALAAFFCVHVALGAPVPLPIERIAIRSDNPPTLESISRTLHAANTSPRSNLVKRSLAPSVTDDAVLEQRIPEALSMYTRDKDFDPKLIPRDYDNSPSAVKRDDIEAYEALEKKDLVPSAKIKRASGEDGEVGVLSRSSNGEDHDGETVKRTIIGDGPGDEGHLDDLIPCGLEADQDDSVVERDVNEIREEVATPSLARDHPDQDEVVEKRDPEPFGHLGPGRSRGNNPSFLCKKPPCHRKRSQDEAVVDRNIKGSRGEVASQPGQDEVVEKRDPEPFGHLGPGRSRGNNPSFLCKKPPCYRKRSEDEVSQKRSPSASTVGDSPVERLTSLQARSAGGGNDDQADQVAARDDDDAKLVGKDLESANTATDQASIIVKRSPAPWSTVYYANSGRFIGSDLAPPKRHPLRPNWKEIMKHPHHPKPIEV